MFQNPYNPAAVDSSVYSFKSNYAMGSVRYARRDGKVRAEIFLGSHCTYYAYEYYVDDSDVCEWSSSRGSHMGRPGSSTQTSGSFVRAVVRDEYTPEPQGPPPTHICSVKFYNGLSQCEKDVPLANLTLTAQSGECKKASTAYRSSASVDGTVLSSAIDVFESYLGPLVIGPPIYDVTVNPTSLYGALRVNRFGRGSVFFSSDS